jgi:hypothetical protein
MSAKDQRNKTKQPVTPLAWCADCEVLCRTESGRPPYWRSFSDLPKAFLMIEICRLRLPSSTTLSGQRPCSFLSRTSPRCSKRAQSRSKSFGDRDMSSSPRWSRRRLAGPFGKGRTHTGTFREVLFGKLREFSELLHRRLRGRLVSLPNTRGTLWILAPAQDRS